MDVGVGVKARGMWAGGMRATWRPGCKCNVTLLAVACVWVAAGEGAPRASAEVVSMVLYMVATIAVHYETQSAFAMAKAASVL